MMKTLANIAPLVVVLLLGLGAPRAIAGDAELLLSEGKVAEALEAARDEATASPGDLDAQELYIDLLLAFGLGPRAERRYRARVREQPEDPDSWYLVGRSAVGADDAREAYEAALRFDPEHARSHMGMAAVHLAAGRIERASAAYAIALQGDASLSEAWLGLVRSLAAEGHVAEALEAAKHAQTRIPEEPGIYLALATLAPDQARTILLQGTERAPGDARLHARLAEELLAAGDGASALRSSTTALQRDERLSDALRAKIFAEEMVKDRIDGSGYQSVRELVAVEPAAALPRWDALVEAYPRSSLVRAGRARVYEVTGNVAAAGADLEVAQRLGTNTEVQAALGLLRLREGHAAEAAPLLALAWESRSWDVSLGLALAEALFQSEQVPGAMKLLEGLAATQPFDLRIGRRYAQALLDADEPEKAYSFIRQRLGRVPDPQLGVALIAAALATGRTVEAASIVEDIAEQTNNPRLREAATRLRSGG